MKLFEMIIDDGKDIFKTWIAAKNKKAAMEEIKGNGNIEKITDVTQIYTISLEKLEIDLRTSGWGVGERELICALICEHLEKNKM